MSITMNKRIIYPTDDGGVAVVIPALEARQKILVSEVINPGEDDQIPAVYRDQTDDEFIEWLAQKDVPTGKPFKIVNAEDIPSDRTFRSAWEYQP